MAEPYHDAILRRLGVIGGMGQEALQLGQQQQSMPQQPTNNSYGIPSASPGNNFGNFLAAEARLESGGNYGAINRSSGATGKYQIMPSNIGPWSQEALGHSVSRSQFLGSPSIQEQVAQYKLRQYYNKWGPYGAAVAWYAGPGRVGGNLTPAISAYALRILKYMGIK